MSAAGFWSIEKAKEISFDPHVSLQFSLEFHLGDSSCKVHAVFTLAFNALLVLLSVAWRKFYSHQKLLGFYFQTMEDSVTDAMHCQSLGKLC